MKRAVKPALALVEGCALCGVTRADMLVLRPSGVMLCRPCAGRMGSVARTLDPDDAGAHYDLAMAYIEMGLAHDALGEASFALRETAAHDMAEAVFNWVFGERHARPDAFARVISAMKRS